MGTEECGAVDIYANATNCTFTVSMPEPVTRIDLGNTSLMVTRRYTWLQKRMMGWFFGWTVTDLE